jgi:hypothetical protein
LLEQWQDITLIDLEPEHCRIAEYRLKHVNPAAFDLGDAKPAAADVPDQTDLFADDIINHGDTVEPDTETVDDFDGYFEYWSKLE